MHTQVTTRDLIRNYKQVIETIKKTKAPAVVMNQKEPQVAIISLDDLDELNSVRMKRSTQTLMDLVGSIPAGSGLPADLSAKHNEYTWD